MATLTFCLLQSGVCLSVERTDFCQDAMHIRCAYSPPSLPAWKDERIHPVSQVQMSERSAVPSHAHMARAQASATALLSAAGAKGVLRALDRCLDQVWLVERRARRWRRAWMRMVRAALLAFCAASGPPPLQVSHSAVMNTLRPWTVQPLSPVTVLLPLVVAEPRALVSWQVHLVTPR